MHPSTHTLFIALIHAGSQGAGANHSWPRVRAGYSVDRSPVYCGTTYRDTTKSTLLRITLLCLFLDRGKKPENPERTDADADTTCKLHQERSMTQKSNPEPSCWETRGNLRVCLCEIIWSVSTWSTRFQHVEPAPAEHSPAAALNPQW